MNVLLRIYNCSDLRPALTDIQPSRLAQDSSNTHEYSIQEINFQYKQLFFGGVCEVSKVFRVPTGHGINYTDVLSRRHISPMSVFISQMYRS